MAMTSSIGIWLRRKRGRGLGASKIDSYQPPPSVPKTTGPNHFIVTIAFITDNLMIIDDDVNYTFLHTK